MSSRRRLPALVILALVLFATGCTPTRPPQPEGDPGTSQAVLGDPRTVDPCTLTDPMALRDFGEVENAGTVSLDYCLLHVQLGGGQLAQLAVGQLERVDPGRAANGDPVVPHGPVRVVQDAPLPGHCARQVLFTDSVAMQVSADLLVGEPGPGLCSVAQAGADAALKVLDEHRVGHRSFPPNSLALTDPCAEVDLAAVRRIPGLEQAEPQGSPARHQCLWGREAADAPRVQFQHTAGDPPKVLHQGASEQQIAGRRSVVSIVGGDPRLPLCSVETGHVPFGDPASGQVEVAMLVVAMPGRSGPEACDHARDVAAATWPHLPRA